MESPVSFRLRKAHAGSVLLLALWALLLLSSVVFAWVKSINQDIEIVHQANSGLDARALAHSGVWIALHPLVTRQTPLLDGTFGGSRGYSAKLTGEGGKLNLNWLLQGADQDPRKRQLLQNYLSRRGLSYEECETLIDSMLDWIQPGNLHHFNGAQDSSTYKNAHRPFLNIDEVAQVNGSGPLVSQSGWQDDFTLYSQGPVDLQAASLLVLESVPGIGDARAARFLGVRMGPDKIDGTKDDYIFSDINEAMSLLGIGNSQAAALNGLVSLGDPTYHVISVGWSGDVKRQVEVVAQKSGPAPSILYWKEL